jgi:hypothetical protein
MGEFGHIYGRLAGGGCFDVWGAGPFVIEAEGRRFRFEDSDRFGPSLVKKNGDIRERPFPAEGSPFWVAHRCWASQGRRLAEDGVTCIWDPPRPTIYRLIGRTRMIIKHGDPDGGFREEAPFRTSLSPKDTGGEDA